MWRAEDHLTPHHLYRHYLPIPREILDDLDFHQGKGGGRSKHMDIDTYRLIWPRGRLSEEFVEP